jgi:voltage-gated potassium channel
MPELARELLVLLGMVAVTVVIHMLGLIGLTTATRIHIEHFRTRWLALDRLLVPLTMVMGLFLLHALEVLAYAGTFQAVRATFSWEEALYLSAGAYSTAGWAGVIVPPAWRLLAGFESLNGMLLLGWSTAFLFQSLHRILQTEETHPLPEGAIAEETAEKMEEKPQAAATARPSPRRNRSGNGAP